MVAKLNTPNIAFPMFVPLKRKREKEEKTIVERVDQIPPLYPRLRNNEQNHLGSGVPQAFQACPVCVYTRWYPSLELVPCISASKVRLSNNK
jgi:hypothetical protein